VSDQKTLRDEFAMAALNGFCGVGYASDTAYFSVWNHTPPEDLAESCYAIADAMMKARNPGRE